MTTERLRYSHGLSTDILLSETHNTSQHSIQVFTPKESFSLQEGNAFIVYLLYLHLIIKWNERKKGADSVHGFHVALHGKEHSTIVRRANMLE